jgi:hypothetical protein
MPRTKWGLTIDEEHDGTRRVRWVWRVAKRGDGDKGSGRTTVRLLALAVLGLVLILAWKVAPVIVMGLLRWLGT